MQRGNGRCHLTWFQLVIGLVDCSYCVRPAVQDKKNCLQTLLMSERQQWYLRTPISVLSVREIVRATRRTQGPNLPLSYAAVLVAIHKENQKLPASPCNEIMAVIISAVLCTTGRGRSRTLHPHSKGLEPQCMRLPNHHTYISCYSGRRHFKEGWDHEIIMVFFN